MSRYPGDQYDRFWWASGTNPQWANMSTAQAIQPDPGSAVPLPVLQTAAAAAGNGTALNYPWRTTRATYCFMVLLHFADFQSAQLRQFDVYFNGDRLGQGEKPYSPPYLAAASVRSGWHSAVDGMYNLTLAATAASQLPPMLNALEIYTAIAMDSPATFRADCELSFFSSPAAQPHYSINCSFVFFLN